MESVNWELIGVFFLLIMSFGGVFWALWRLSLCIEDGFNRLEKIIQISLDDSAQHDKDTQHRIDEHVLLPVELAHGITQNPEA